MTKFILWKVSSNVPYTARCINTHTYTQRIDFPELFVVLLLLCVLDLHFKAMIWPTNFIYLYGFQYMLQSTLKYDQDSVTTYIALPFKYRTLGEGEK